MQEVRRLIPKMREISTNRLRNVSASIIESAKRCLVKYTILQGIVLFARSVGKSPWIEISKITINIYFCIRVCSGSLRKRKNTEQFCVQEFNVDKEFHEMIRQGVN